MKDKILTLIIGILIGAIIMTCICLAYIKKIEKNDSEINTTTAQDNFQNPDFPQDGNMPTPPDGDFSGERPETPEKENGMNREKPEGEPPAKPEEKKVTTNTES